MSKYAALGDYHWRDYADPSSAYRRHVLFLQTLIPFGSRVLDVGAGDGLIGSVLRDFRGCEVLGIEPDPEALRWAAVHGAPVQEGSVERMPEGWFDVVLFGDVLEHLPDPEQALRDASSRSDRVLIVVPPLGFYDDKALRQWSEEGLLLSVARAGWEARTLKKTKERLYVEGRLCGPSTPPSTAARTS
jgi:SAM-dependent methyltransferase